MIGPHIAAMMRAMQQQPSKLLPQRNPTQALMRILGLDIKPLSPDLYRKAEEYRKAKGAPACSAWRAGIPAGCRQPCPCPALHGAHPAGDRRAGRWMRPLPPSKPSASPCAR